MADADILRAGELARELLLRQKPARLPVKVERLIFDRNLVIDSLERYCALTGDTLERLCAGAYAALKDGCVLVKQRKNRKIYIILYNNRVGSLRRRNFTLAHEVGHIYLEHQEDGPEEERQANAFAAELLMPRVLASEYLKMLGDSPDPAFALAQTFSVSMSMARLRLRSIAREETCAALEKELLTRYRTALPHPNEPEIAY